MGESVHLTDLQFAIVRILWASGSSTVVAVQAALLPERELAQTTVATLLSRLERRGVVSHQLVGRQYVYRPEVTEPAVRRSMVGDLTDLLFQGRTAALLSHLIVERDIAAGELDEVKRLIAAVEERVVASRR